MLSILKKVLHALEKNEYSAAVGWNVLHMTLFPLQSKSNVSLLIFYLNILSINESRVLKSSTIIILLCVPLFSLVNVCFTYLGALMLGADTIFLSS